MAEAETAGAVAAVAEGSDRVGIGWRGEIAAGILSNLDRIDVVELIADDHFAAGKGELRALRRLAAQVPLTLHGVSLGLVSTEAAEVQLIERMARVFEAVRPESWSEHLAFVRAGGIEIGHLAAPPRTADTIEGGAANLDLATRIVGTPPLLENIATLIDPPGSDRDEATWLSQIVHTSGHELLLDLHNLHANATNFRFDAREFLSRIPIDRVTAVHISGGRWVSAPPPYEDEERLLDDHLHNVPDAVYALLVDLAFRATRQLTVILERDGNYPPMPHLLAQLDAARTALAEGRARSAAMAAI